jgi:streptomycin 6-kinase
MAALLRNPATAPLVFSDPRRIERRVAILSSRLRLDAGRVVQWAFALGVLSAIWHVEDGYAVGPDNVPLTLARALEPMIS